MKDEYTEGNYYTIGHIAQFTGLTDRTIRNYISMGILTGEKINGVWHFTPEQVRDFVSHSTVYPSIQAKKNGKVFDFLMDTKKQSHQICAILDLPGEDEKVVPEYFCHTITAGDFQNITFSFDSINHAPRVILKGDAGEVLRLMNGFYSRNS